MADITVVSVSDIILRGNYELRNTAKRQYPDAEMLNYVNKCLEMIHMILVGVQSDLVRTGRGEIVTVPGQEMYDLGDAGMGDLWTIWTISRPGYTPLELSEEYSRQADGIRIQTGFPCQYFLEGSSIGFVPVPATEMTFQVIYFPAFVPVDAESNMPFLNLFNLAMIEAIQLFAKHRNAENPALNAQLQQIFSDRAMEIVRQRQRRVYQQRYRFK